MVETRSARARGVSPSSKHSREASEPATPRVARVDTSPPSPSRPTDTAPGPSRAQAPPSPGSVGELSGPLQAPVTSSHRAGKEPAPYYPSKSARGRGRGGRGPSAPHYPPMEGARSFPDDVMCSMTQAIERLERATYVAAAHGPPPPAPPPVVYLVVPPTAPPITQAYQEHREPHQTVNSYGDPYDHRHLDSAQGREDPSRQDAPRQDDGHDRLGGRWPRDTYNHRDPVYHPRGADMLHPPPPPPPTLLRGLSPPRPRLRIRSEGLSGLPSGLPPTRGV